jgi:antitoxin component of MazEF toxin-antitoxin module
VPIRTKLRRVGDSLGVILPKRELELRRMKEGDEVEIPSVHKVAARDLFGVWKERPAKVGETGA